MVKFRKAYKFQLKLNKKQRWLCAEFAGCCRFVWNKALELQKGRVERKQKVLRYGDLALLLRLWRSSQEYEFLKNGHSQTQQQTLMFLDQALWMALKSKKGFPRFKKKGVCNSFRYPQGYKVEGKKIYLPKIGWVRFRKSREIEGVIKNVTVSQEGDHWYVAIGVEIEVEKPIHPSKTAIGADVGVVNTVTLSDGSVYRLVEKIADIWRELKKEQRSLSRKRKFSKNFKKQKAVVKRTFRRFVNVRRDFLHKVSTQISKSHAIVVLEDLRIKNMTASAKGSLEDPGRNVRAKSALNREILSQGWYELRRMLTYKMEWQGGGVIFVNPRNTSITCPRCRYIDPKNRRTQAEFRCRACGLTGPADVVAAINILRAGHAQIACGDIIPDWGISPRIPFL